MQAVVTGVLAHLFLDEHLKFSQYIGSAAVIFGVFVVQKQGEQQITKSYDNQSS